MELWPDVIIGRAAADRRHYRQCLHAGSERPMAATVKTDEGFDFIEVILQGRGDCLLYIKSVVESCYCSTGNLLSLCTHWSHTFDHPLYQ